MAIDAISNYNTYSYPVKSVKANKDISFKTANSKESDSNLALYKDICAKYPDITFRLDDLNEARKPQYQDNPYLGYNNSMNQSGDNFGGLGQCSINIDISVIEHMQKDSNYKAKVLGMIEVIQREYSNYEMQTKQDGFIYTSVGLEDVGGELQRSIAESNASYSTEDEIKRMWPTKQSDIRYVQIVDSAKRDLFETYMEMLEKSRSSVKYD
ncbi:MAG: hypothetical protein HUJ70_02600 [Pseudobutyrivibrio sp.]|nr:hypothetical protein [Pseudobutyrivibrio sp.]